MLILAFFHRKSAIFVISRNTNIDCILKYNFYFLAFFESLNIALINVAAILITPAKLATLGLLKTKIF